MILPLREQRSKVGMVELDLWTTLKIDFYQATVARFNNVDKLSLELVWNCVSLLKGSISGFSSLED